MKAKIPNRSPGREPNRGAAPKKSPPPAGRAPLVIGGVVLASLLVLLYAMYGGPGGPGASSRTTVPGSANSTSASSGVGGSAAGPQPVTAAARPVPAPRPASTGASVAPTSTAAERPDPAAADRVEERPTPPTPTAEAPPPAREVEPPIIVSQERFADPEARYPEITSLVLVPTSLEWVTVEKVIDGDTVHTTEGEKIRLIGINTPEKGQPVCAAATAFLATLVKGKKVGLQLEVEKIDQFKRRLANLFVDGRFVNGEMVRRGYAHHYRWEPNVKHAKALLALQKSAREEKLGIWSLPLPEPAESYVTRNEDHVFHRPECSQARRYQEKARVRFATRDEAYDTGRKPCPSCRP